MPKPKGSEGKVLLEAIERLESVAHGKSHFVSVSADDVTGVCAFAKAMLAGDPDLTLDRVEAEIGHITSRQREIYQLIRDNIQDKGRPPTIREIMDKTDINSPNGVCCHLKALEKKGLIAREPGTSRNIRLL